MAHHLIIYSTWHSLCLHKQPFTHSERVCVLCVCPQPCYERVKDWLNENLVALWIFALCTALTQVITAFSDLWIISLAHSLVSTTSENKYLQCPLHKVLNTGFLWTAGVNLSLLCHSWRPHRRVWLSIHSFFFFLSPSLLSVTWYASTIWEEQYRTMCTCCNAAGSFQVTLDSLCPFWICYMQHNKKQKDVIATRLNITDICDVCQLTHSIT